MRWLRGWTYRLLALVVAANVFAMMALTFVDVFARYLFNAPLKGAYEVISFMLAGLVFSSLPLVTRDREHISVEISETVGAPWLRRAKGSAVAAFCAVVLGLMAWRTAVHGLVLRDSQQVTGFLELPIYPVAWFIGLMCAIAAAAALGVAVRSIRGGGAE